MIKSQSTFFPFTFYCEIFFTALSEFTLSDLSWYQFSLDNKVFLYFCSLLPNIRLSERKIISHHFKVDVDFWRWTQVLGKCISSCNFRVLWTERHFGSTDLCWYGKRGGVWWLQGGNPCSPQAALRWVQSLLLEAQGWRENRAWACLR